MKIMVGDIKKSFKVLNSRITKIEPPQSLKFALLPTLS